MLRSTRVGSDRSFRNPSRCRRQLALLAADGSRVQAQTPPAPCACSRSTPIVGSGRGERGTRPVQPRFGIIALPVRRRHVREPGSLRLGGNAPALLRQVAEPGIQDPRTSGIRRSNLERRPSWPSRPCARRASTSRSRRSSSGSASSRSSTTRRSTRSSPSWRRCSRSRGTATSSTARRRAPRPAGKGYADPKYQLSVEWSETRAKLQGRREAAEEPALALAHPDRQRLDAQRAHLPGRDLEDAAPRAARAEDDRGRCAATRPIFSISPRSPTSRGR